MIRVEIEPIWRFRHDGGGESMLVMLDFLNEIRSTGTLTEAAVRMRMSYRHSWNLVMRWSDFFGAPLVEPTQGKGTRLTELGEKLVGAGQRLQRRYRPQLQRLAQELEAELGVALPQHAACVRMQVSHGFAVSKLREILDRTPEPCIDLRYATNRDSLAALAHGACEITGLHLPRGALRRKVWATVQPWLSSSEFRVISFVTRQMGLIVARGNPLQITCLQGLASDGVRFVNREPESGARQLLALLLADSGVDPQQIDGYERAEFTHAAVAAYVASGMADVAFGVEAAARQFDLDFVNLVTEDYYLVCRRALLEGEAMQHLFAILQSDELRAGIAALPGYSAAEAGIVKGVRSVLRSG